MSDAPTIKLSAPLPDNALEARLTWRRERGGLRGDQDVARADATHATLWIKGLDGKGSERRVTLEDADAYLSAAQGLAASTAAFDARASRRREEETSRRDEVAAGLRLDCPHCAVPRVYAGPRNLLSAGAPEHVARAEGFQLARPQATAYHEYACPRCGSVELFRAGTLEHPLPGAGDPG